MDREELAITITYASPRAQAQYDELIWEFMESWRDEREASEVAGQYALHSEPTEQRAL